MNWLWIGDSHLEAMLPRIRDLSAEKGVGGSILARSGWSSGKWLREGSAASRIAEKQPDMVVYVLGTNDDPVTPQAVQGLVAAAGSRPVVWFGPFHSAAKDATFRTLLGDRYVSGASLAAGLPFPRGNVHLTAAGYKDLAARLVDAALAQRSRRIHPAIVVGGTIAAGIVLIAVFGRNKVYYERWKPGEFNPFDPKDWARKRAARKRQR